jgi:hypothetical protein
MPPKHSRVCGAINVDIWLPPARSITRHVRPLHLWGGGKGASHKLAGPPHRLLVRELHARLLTAGAHNSTITLMLSRPKCDPRAVVKCCRKALFGCHICQGFAVVCWYAYLQGCVCEG